MSDTDPTARSMTDMLHDQFERQRDGVAKRLRDLADRVQRETPYLKSGAPYGSAAASVVSEISNGLPNLNLYGLITAAADADMQIARDRESEKASVREGAAAIAKALVAAYPNPDRLLDDAEITVRCTLREIATALGVDLDAALAKEEL